MKWLLLTEKKVIVMTGTPAGELELFKDYEICINGEWQPFGVMEDD